jgi:hypothetical protein
MIIKAKISWSSSHFSFMPIVAESIIVVIVVVAISVAKVGGVFVVTFLQLWA